MPDLHDLRPHELACVGLLEALGFAFELDYDGAFEIRYPLEWEQQPAAVAAHLQSPRVARRIAAVLEARRSREMRHFVGGPFHGQPHAWPRSREAGELFAARLKRAWWAVYRAEGDGRLFFIGHATSERKARAGELAETGGQLARWAR